MLLRLKILFNHKIVLVSISVILALCLQLVPLTNTLDFEFSALMGLWFFIAGGIFFLKWKESCLIIPFLRSRFLYLALIIFLPFLISLVNSLFLSVCPFGNGVLFYLFVSIVSLFLGIFLGSISKSIAGTHPYLLFSFSVFAFAVISLLEIYFYPQVFTFNPLIGLFPGTVYDELIEFDSKFFFYRLYNVALFLAFIYAVRIIHKGFIEFWLKINKSKILKAISSIGLLLIFFVCYWLGNLLFGFTIPLSKIEKDLKGKLITEHFIMIYPKEIPKESVIISALHHEFYYEEISKALNITKKEKIISILFGTSGQKKKYIGVANADISKPWLNSVVTDFTNNDISLKHEIVHAFSAEFGWGFLKLSYNINPVLLEGIAEAVEDKYGSQDLYSAAFMIKKFNKNISLQKLFGGLNFFGQASSISYAYSGAFIKFLNEKYGVEKLKKLYTDPDFGKYYGKSLPELENEFVKFIEGQGYIYNSNRALLYFAGKPLFLKKCPRYVAYRMKAGNELFTNKDYRNALEVYRDVYVNAESNSALSGIVNSLIRLNRSREALDFLSKEIKNFEKSTSIFSLRILLADLYVRNENYDKALEIYKSIIADNPHQDYVINASIKFSLASDGNNVLKRYVEGDKKERTAIILGKNSLTTLYKIFWLSGFDDENREAILDLVKKNDAYYIKDDTELYAALKISQFLKDIGKFDIAKEFAEKTINYNLSDIGIRNLLAENLKKINFLINFKDRIIKKFIFN